LEDGTRSGIILAGALFFSVICKLRGKATLAVEIAARQSCGNLHVNLWVENGSRARTESRKVGGGGGGGGLFLVVVAFGVHGAGGLIEDLVAYGVQGHGGLD
jgi:hypothetical protein